MLLAQQLQLVQQGQALGLEVGGHLAHQDSGVHRILVAHVGAGQVAVALLEAKDVAFRVALLLQQADLFADELEAGQHVAQLHAVLLADRHGHLGGHDGLDSHRRLRLVFMRTNIIKEQHAHVVAGDQHDLVPHADARADAVAVRVGGQAHVRTGGDGLFDGQLHGLANLGVRIGAGGEIAVGLFLLGDDLHVDVAHTLHHLADGHIAGTVQRAVHQVQALGRRRNTQAFHHLIVALDGLVVDPGDHALCHQRVEVRQLVNEGLLGADVTVDAVRRLDGDLAAIRTVDLVAVELGRVVAGRDHHARRGVQVTHGVGQHGRGHQGLVDVHADAHLRQGRGGQAGKVGGMDAAVAAYRTGGVLEGFLEVLAQAAGRLGHGIKVHPVGARAQHAAQSAGAKGQLPVEAVGDLLLVHGLELGEQLVVHAGAVEPLLILGVHHHSPPKIMYK